MTREDVQNWVAAIVGAGIMVALWTAGLVIVGAG